MPYSDNLYSMVDDDSDLDPEPIDHVLNYEPRQNLPYGGGGEGEELYDDVDVDVESDDVFSPTDGYFRAPHETGTSSSASLLYPPPLPLTLSADPGASNSQSQPQQAPHVPNIWVQDPSLGPGTTAESKAREADQERQTCTTSSQPASSTASSPAPVASYPGQDAYSYRYQPSSSSAYNSSSSGAPHTSYTRRPQPPYYNNLNSHFFSTPSEAPPAYTPSPTSPTSSNTSRNYRTFSDLYHNTSTTMAGGEETRGVFARDPESMGGPMTPLLSSSSRRERLGRWLKRHWKLSLAGLLLLLVTIAVLSGVLTGLSKDVSRVLSYIYPSPPRTSQPRSMLTKHQRGNRLDGNLPIKEPVNKPPMNPPDNHDGFQWRSGWGCKSDKIARPVDQFEVSFAADKALKIVQDVASKNADLQAPHYRHVQVQGQVIFRRSSESGNPSSAIVLQVSASDDRIKVDTEWESNKQSLLVTVPNNIPWDETPEGPCVNILATVWVPKDGLLDNLEVITTQLGISLYDNLSLSVSKDTRLSSTSGSIVSAATGFDSPDDQIYDMGAPDKYQFRSRIIEAKTTSAPIKGSWPLLDYLGLISTSGNIKACIEPKEVDKEKPAPAMLYIKSFSGDVEFREPIHAAQDAFTVAQAWKEAGREQELNLHPETVLPPRDYRVEVHTTSGNIRGSVAFSSGAGFKSTGGNMHLDLLPVLDVAAAGGQKMSSLTTASTSGSNELYMLEPLWVGQDGSGMGMRYVPFPSAGPGVPASPGPVEGQEPTEDGNDLKKDEPNMIIASSAAAALRSITSQHSLTSGDMNLHYPAAWEGELSLTTHSGKLTAVGQGVELIKTPGSGYPKYILARKGSPGAGSRFVAKTTSGDIFVKVGN
ncbi:hypothetical protein QBC37DRAFT_456386 [Rhypophila decipiens]|uniref:Uncharacterized protein n=1 Tax=Rhypophila decipiens TaxID=261697 RepID=A0AAN6YDT2_9PEZI|nr:hypothetical protein QBC37DRAFT_456386 [Rhypophila decipiens]